MKTTVLTAALAALTLVPCFGQGQFENIVVYDRLNQAGTPIDGFAGVIISQDIDTVREIYRVEALVDVERIGSVAGPARTGTVSLVVGIWNSGEFYFQSEFGDWATAAGSYLVATNSVKTNLPAAAGHTRVRIAVTFPRENFYQEGDFLVGLFPYAEEETNGVPSTLRVRCVGSGPAFTSDTVKSFWVEGPPFNPFPINGIAPNAKVTQRRLVAADSQPTLTILPVPVDSTNAVTLSWPTKYPGWTIFWDYDLSFSFGQEIYPDVEQFNQRNIQPATIESDRYLFEVPRTELDLPRFFKIFYSDFFPYVPRLVLEQSGFGGPPIVPLPQ